MTKIAIFPGSFSPFTVGHQSIVDRALPLFDKIIISIGINSEKNQYFSIEERLQWIKDVYGNNPKIEIKFYEGLTVDFCKKENAGFIIRGIRNTTDFNYEQPIAQTNFKMAGIESIFLSCSPSVSNISSSIVRDVMRNKGDYSDLVPKSVTT